MTSLISSEHQHSWSFNSWTISVESLPAKSSHFPNPDDGFCITPPHFFILTAMPLGQDPTHIALNGSNSTVGIRRLLWSSPSLTHKATNHFSIVHSNEPLSPNKMTCFSQPSFLCSCYFFHLDFHFPWACICNSSPSIYSTNINEYLLCADNFLGAGDPVMIKTKSICSWNLLLAGKL